MLTYSELIQTVFTLSQNYYQPMVNTFREIEWKFEQTEKSQTENSQVRVR